jgi:hypothetical protein
MCPKYGKASVTSSSQNENGGHWDLEELATVLRIVRQLLLGIGAAAITISYSSSSWLLVLPWYFASTE